MSCIAWTPELRAQILPRRGGEAQPVCSDPAAAWARMRQRFALNARLWKASPSLTHRQSLVLHEVIERLEWNGDGLPPVAYPELEGALLIVLSLGDGEQKPALDDEIITFWVATARLSFAVEALQAALRYRDEGGDNWRESIDEDRLCQKRGRGPSGSARRAG